MTAFDTFETNMIEFTCPLCRTRFEVADRHEAPHRPFCCARCQMIDLGRWLNGEYVVSDALLPDLPDMTDTEASSPESS